MITAAEIQLIRDADPGAILPGIDTMTGNPYATSTLLDVTKLTQNSSAPYFYRFWCNLCSLPYARAHPEGLRAAQWPGSWGWRSYSRAALRS